VGGTKNPGIERIIELAPDLVLMNEEENRIEDAQALRKAGLTVHSTFPRTVTETAAMVRSIGTAIGQAASGERIAAEIEERATLVRVRNGGVQPVRFAYLIWRQPWMSINDDTFVAGLLGLAGGLNVFGDLAARYPTITIEDLASAAPEVVLLSSEPFPFAEKHVEELHLSLGWPHAAFRLVDGEMLSWHGSRTRGAITYADELFQELRASRVTG
jgi:ABC-type Fe3+-hydroxamate transport system substrate-binding protein